jgi:hypothetical protein
MDSGDILSSTTATVSLIGPRELWLATAAPELLQVVAA